MSCYLIPVGGTGARVMRALIHLAACGAFGKLPDNSKQMKLMGIDADLINNAKSIMTETLQDYDTVRRALSDVEKSEHGIFCPEIYWDSNIGAMWSPMTQMDTTMRQDVLNEIQEEESKDLFSFLYSEEESNLQLNGGFYSHTSVGSYFILNGIIDQAGNFNKEWKDFFGGITGQDQIIIICSMYGGTGASGTPTIARELRNHTETGADTSRACISGIFLEPYFISGNNDRDGNESVHTDEFPIKSKIAFKYYKQQRFDQDIFDNMYFLGENAELMHVAHNERGDDQRNKANMIELYAASAVLDILLRNGEHRPGQGKVWITTRGTSRKDNIFSRNALKLKYESQAVNIFNHLKYFMAFSVFYTKALYPLTEKHERSLGRFKAAFLDKYDLLEKTGKNLKQQDAVEKLNASCMQFIEWVREIITLISDYRQFKPDDLNDNSIAQELPYAKWFKRNNKLYNGKTNGRMEARSIATIDAFADMIYSKGKENDLPQSVKIYDSICKRRGHHHTLGRLINDVLTLLEGGKT